MKVDADRVITTYLFIAAFLMGAAFGMILEGAYRDGWRLRSPVERIVPADLAEHKRKTTLAGCERRLKELTDAADKVKVEMAKVEAGA